MKRCPTCKRAIWPKAPAKKLSEPTRKVKATAKKERILSEAEIVRDAVLVRANGRCEGCGEEAGAADPLEVDHFYGGNGRKRQLQSISTCWALHRSCHRRKTDNVPGRATWDALFRLHTERHGYPFKPRKEAAVPRELR